MEMSISPKLCGAEVYACNVGKMKCWFGWGTKPTGTNGDEMERIYRKHTENQLDIFLFTAQLMGGGEIEEIAQSADKLSSCLERSLTAVPIFKKPFIIFIAAGK